MWAIGTPPKLLYGTNSAKSQKNVLNNEDNDHFENSKKAYYWGLPDLYSLHSLSYSGETIYLINQTPNFLKPCLLSKTFGQIPFYSVSGIYNRGVILSFRILFEKNGKNDLKSLLDRRASADSIVQICFLLSVPAKCVRVIQVLSVILKIILVKIIKLRNVYTMFSIGSVCITMQNLKGWSWFS